MTTHRPHDRARRSNLDSPEMLLASWESFVTLASSAQGRGLVATADAVEALIGRTMLARSMERGSALDLKRLANVDREYIRIAPSLWSSTRLGLYASDAAPQDWWWRVGLEGTEGSDVLDLSAAAQHKAVHVQTLRAAIHRGELPARRIGRTYWTLRRDLDQWRPRPVGRPRSSSPDSELASFLGALEVGNAQRAQELAPLLAKAPTSGLRAAAVAIAESVADKPVDALEWIGRAKGLTGRPAGALAMLKGIVLKQLGRYEDAVREFEVALKALPGDPVIVEALAEALELAGRPRVAGDVVRSAADVPGAPEELQFVAARVLFRCDEVIAALRYVERLRRGGDATREARILEGRILGRLGDLTGRLSAYEEASALFENAADDDPEVQELLGYAVGRLGRWEEALSLAERLGTNSAAAREVGRVAIFGALQSSNLEAAFAAAREFERVVDPTPLTRAFRALELALTERKDEAIKTLSESYRGEGFATVEEAAISTIAWVAAGQPNTAVSLLGPLVRPTDAPANLLILMTYAATEAGQMAASEDALSRLAESSSEAGFIAGITLDWAHLHRSVAEDAAQARMEAALEAADARIRAAQDAAREGVLAALASRYASQPAPVVGWTAPKVELTAKDVGPYLN